MDKITHQVREEHWARILNECMNNGMSKTAWCRANGISVKQFFTGSASCAGKPMKHLRIHHYLQLQRQNRCLLFRERYLSPKSNSLLCHQTRHPFSIRIW